MNLQMLPKLLELWVEINPSRENEKNPTHTAIIHP